MWQWAVLLSAIAGVGWWGWSLQREASRSIADAPRAAAAVNTGGDRAVPAGPRAEPTPQRPAPPQTQPKLRENAGKSALPSPTPLAKPAPAGPDPVPNALLRVGRNCVARRVTAVWGSVSDETSMRAADVDLVARGLALVGFPLREAIIRYRARQPRKYARDGAPRTSVALRRVLTTAHVTAFLQTFAEKLPLGTALEDAPHWLPGDIILVKPSRRRAKLMLAIVSDRTDDAGMSLLLTLDPADKRARELHNLHSYPVRGHFRLRRDQLERARAKLGMAKSRSPVTL